MTLVGGKALVGHRCEATGRGSEKLSAIYSWQMIKEIQTHWEEYKWLIIANRRDRSTEERHLAIGDIVATREKQFEFGG
jgi:hypothetical protein